MLVPENCRRKLGIKSRKCIFVGYNPIDSVAPTRKKMVLNEDVKFDASSITSDKGKYGRKNWWNMCKIYKLRSDRGSGGS